MNELVSVLNAGGDEPVMIRAAMAHLNLVMIHPFSDGNGRMGRCLQTFVLAREGIMSPQFCSIEEYLGRFTPDYYAVLGDVGAGAWHPERDATNWIKFCLTAHFRQATTLLRRSRELSRLWETLEELATKEKMPERMIHALAEASLGFRVRNVTYRGMVDATVSTASGDLAWLVKQGWLVAKGVSRGRFYFASERLRTLVSRIKEPKSPLEDPFVDLQADDQGVPLGDRPNVQPQLPGLWLDET
jgi:Fic family protein